MTVAAWYPRRSVSKGASIFLAAALLLACRAATEIAVSVQTDLPCDQVQSAALRVVGGADDASVSTKCEPQGDGAYLGTVVLVPGASRDGRLQIVVTATLDGGSCDTPADAGLRGCIVEQRDWAFVPHDSLTATVLLPRDCVNIRCDGGTTCDPTGACVPLAQCNFAACAPADAGADAGSAADAAPDVDATVPMDAPETAPADAGSDATLPEPDAAEFYTLGGTLSGLLDGGAVVLDDDAAGALTLTANGPFAFPNLVTSSYAVTVASQPPGPRPEQCVVTNGTGAASPSPVTDVAVVCTEVPMNHRTDDSQCATPPPAGTCTMSSQGSACTADGQCTAGVNGRCIMSTSGPVSCACEYDACLQDTDCPSGELCVCQGSAYRQAALNACVTSNCRVDSDCGPGGYCSPSLGNGYDGCAGSIYGYFCHVPSDGCVNDADCSAMGTGNRCEWSPASGHWGCQTVGLCQ